MKSSRNFKVISKLKSDLISIYNDAVKSVIPKNVMNSCIKIDGNSLKVFKHQTTVDSMNQSQSIVECFDLSAKKIHLLGAGKSSLLMAHSFLDILKTQCMNYKSIDGFLSFPKNQVDSYKKEIEHLKLSNIECLFGAKNNIPDEDSVNATKLMLESLDKLHRVSALDEHLFIFFLSGGASACLSLPYLVSLKEKQEIIDAVKKVKNIVDLNIVRSYFSEVKGGKFAANLSKKFPYSKLITLIMSDVVNDPICYIGSGPTFVKQNIERCEESEKQSVLQIIKECNYPYSDHLETILNKHKCDTINIDNSSIYNIIVANNKLALNAAISKAKELNYDTLVVDSTVDCKCSELIEAINKAKRDFFIQNPTKDMCFVIAGGEVLLDINLNDTFSIGGRAQELMLSYMLDKLNTDTCDEDDMFLAGTTDGQDGPTDVAACIGSKLLWDSYDIKPFSGDDLTSALRSHDSNTFWQNKCPEWLIKSGMTGTNVMDIYMAIFRRRHS